MRGWPVGYLQGVEELNSGPAKTNPSSGREEDLNPGPPDYLSSALPLGHARIPSFSLSKKNAWSQVTLRCVRGLFTSSLPLWRITPSLICTAIISYLALSNNCQLHSVEFKTAQAKSLDFWLIYSNQSGLISVVQVYDTSIHHWRCGKKQ